ncbi:MAG: hypothetical protein HC824_03365 [Synechococcales cyanobacterium RM1_1_8]|nr:hypothetical protein [Synechococcales cyanobacterium RM1_1_8]
MQTSTLLVPRALHLAVPLSQAGSKHDDWDWILRLAEYPGTSFEMVAEPLASWNLQTSHSHISSADSNHWRSSRDWIRSHGDRVTPLAYASFLLAEVAARAAAARDWSAFWPLLAEATTQGKPTFKMVALYLGMWLLPSQQRQRLRVWVQQLLRRLPPSSCPSDPAPAAPQP